MGLEPLGAAAHRLAQPTYPRIQPRRWRPAQLRRRGGRRRCSTAAAGPWPPRRRAGYGIKIPGPCLVTPCAICPLPLSHLRVLSSTEPSTRTSPSSTCSPATPRRPELSGRRAVLRYVASTRKTRQFAPCSPESSSVAASVAAVRRRNSSPSRRPRA